MKLSHILSHTLLRLGVASMCAATLSGCFTGIESTPKITAGDVRKEKVTVTDEQLFMKDVDRQPLSQWKPGKQFFVTDDKIALLFGPEAAGISSLKGKIVTFASVTDVTSLTGDKVASFTFLTPQGDPLNYRTTHSINDWMNMPAVDIPFTIEMSVVEQVHDMMLHQPYYIITSQRYDTADNARRGRRFVKVIVDNIEPGNTDYPIRLTLHEDEDRAEDNKASTESFNLFMSVGSGLSAPRDFSSLFSFTDPRRRYPLITDAVWSNIINGKISEGMTRDECRLALGSPASIDRRPGYSYMREIWTYENGIYLMFEDGLLISFRR